MREATIPNTRRRRIIDRATGEVITDSAIRCRTYGHSWDEFFPDDMGVPLFGWRLSLRCVRCTTERHDIIDSRGDVGSRRYIYPQGYSLLLGEEKMTRPEYRVALYEKLRRKLRETHNVNISNHQATGT